MAIEADLGEREVRIMGLVGDIERRVEGGVVPQLAYDPKNPLTKMFTELREEIGGLTGQLGGLRGSNNHHQDPSLMIKNPR